MNKLLIVLLFSLNSCIKVINYRFFKGDIVKIDSLKYVVQSTGNGFYYLQQLDCRADYNACSIIVKESEVTTSDFAKLYNEKKL